MIHEILEAKRDGRALSDAQIRELIDGIVDGRVTRPQAAAFLAFVFNQGMTVDETVALTMAMVESGDQLDWADMDGPFVDKHSTGGVGDKVSLVLAPLWAELGSRVPMISGRGLGHTEERSTSWRRYRATVLTRCTRTADGAPDVGCFISGQTGELAPADRILYALRNETSTVPSIPLITASILSKKLAEESMNCSRRKVGLGRVHEDARECIGARRHALARRTGRGRVDARGAHGHEPASGPHGRQCDRGRRGHRVSQG